MDLRKNLPEQSLNDSSSSGGMIFKAVMGLLMCFFLFIVGIISSFDRNINNSQQKVAETNTASNNQLQQKTPEINDVQRNTKPQKDLSKPVSQSQAKPETPRPSKLKVPDAVKPLDNVFHKSQQTSANAINQGKNIIPQQRVPKPVSQPQAKPVAPRPSNVKPVAPRPSNVSAGSSSGRTWKWLKTAGKFGLAIITKGKVKIR